MDVVSRRTDCGYIRFVFRVCLQGLSSGFVLRVCLHEKDQNTTSNYYIGYPDILLVFAGPVRWTEKKRLKQNWTQLQKARPPVVVAQILKFFGCQVRCLSKTWKTEKNQSRPVATSHLFYYLLDLIYTHMYLIFGLWIIRNGQELVEIWLKTFLYTTQMYVPSVFAICQPNLNKIAWNFDQSIENYSHLRYPRCGIIFFQILLLYREITTQCLVHAKCVR